MLGIWRRSNSRSRFRSRDYSRGFPRVVLSCSMWGKRDGANWRLGSDSRCQKIVGSGGLWTRLLGSTLVWETGARTSIDLGCDAHHRSSKFELETRATNEICCDGGSRGQLIHHIESGGDEPFNCVGCQGSSRLCLRVSVLYWGLWGCDGEFVLGSAGIWSFGSD